MILVKIYDQDKYKILKREFHESRFSMSNSGGKMTIETDDQNLVKFINDNFLEYVSINELNNKIKSLESDIAKMKIEYVKKV